MKPIVRFIDKLDDIKRKRQIYKALKMSNKEVIERIAKLIINDLVRLRTHFLEILIADRSSYEENDETILEYMQRNKKDKKLRTYSHYVPINNRLEFNKTLTNLVAKELEKQGCKVEFISHKNNYSYNTFIEYETTMYVSL